MDINRLKNAKKEKFNREEEYRLKVEQQKNKFAEKHKELEQELLKELNNIKNALVSKISRVLSDEVLDDLLEENIFENDNESDSFTIPITLQYTCLRYNITKIFNDINKTDEVEVCWENTAQCDGQNLLTVFKEIYNIKTPTFKDSSKYYEYSDNKIRHKNTFSKYNTFFTCDANLESDTYKSWLSLPQLSFNGNCYNFPTDFDNSGTYYQNHYYDIINDDELLINSICDRLREYGLTIIDFRYETGFDEDEYCALFKCKIDFKNPLK